MINVNRLFKEVRFRVQRQDKREVADVADVHSDSLLVFTTYIRNMGHITRCGWLCWFQIFSSMFSPNISKIGWHLIKMSQ